MGRASGRGLGARRQRRSGRKCGRGESGGRTRTPLAFLQSPAIIHGAAVVPSAGEGGALRARRHLPPRWKKRPTRHPRQEHSSPAHHQVSQSGFRPCRTLCCATARRPPCATPWPSWLRSSWLQQMCPAKWKWGRPCRCVETSSQEHVGPRGIPVPLARVSAVCPASGWSNAGRSAAPRPPRSLCCYMPPMVTCAAAALAPRRPRSFAPSSCCWATLPPARRPC